MNNFQRIAIMRRNVIDVFHPFTGNVYDGSSISTRSILLASQAKIVRTVIVFVQSIGEHGIQPLQRHVILHLTLIGSTFEWNFDFVRKVTAHQANLCAYFAFLRHEKIIEVTFAFLYPLKRISFHTLNLTFLTVKSISTYPISNAESNIPENYFTSMNGVKYI